MARHRSSGSHGHHVRKIGPDHYRLTWAVDRHYSGSRLRHPVTYRRDTDLAGAQRFARRWSLQRPEA